MAETSYFWQGTAGLGDASLAPYNEDELNQFFRYAFQNDPRYQGPVPGYLNELVVAVVDGSHVSVDTGAALVYGSFYENDALVSLTTGGVGSSQRIVLRKSWAAKTVRLAILASGAAVTQTAGVTWEIELALATVAAGPTITVADSRRFLRCNPYRLPRMPARVFTTVSDYNWNTASALMPNANNLHHTPRMQAGTVNWNGGAAPSGNVAVTFPYAFDYVPIVLVEHYDATVALAVSAVPTVSGFTLYWQDCAGANHTTEDFHWVAFGPIAKGY